MNSARSDTSRTVSVLTPVLNEAQDFEEAVGTILEQDVPGELEVLFIDGGSTDGTRELLEELAARDPRVRVFDNPQRRTPYALNIGLRAAGGTYVARMDAHTLYPRDYLRRGIERLQQGGAAWVSGPQLARGRGRWSRRVELALRSRLGVGGATFRSDLDGEIEVDSGFTGVWERTTLEDHGGWDEGWPINQDGELAARITKEGGVILCVPEMAAHYIPRDSLRALARQYWRYGQYKEKTVVRHPDAMRRSHVLPPGLVLCLLTAIAAPRPLRAPARLAVGLYGTALVAETARLARAEGDADALWLPAVVACMHLPWGAGFLVGALRFGPPVRALGALVRRPSPAGRGASGQP